jgi:hypothetical protein
MFRKVDAMQRPEERPFCKQQDVVTCRRLRVQSAASIVTAGRGGLARAPRGAGRKRRGARQRPQVSLQAVRIHDMDGPLLHEDICTDCGNLFYLHPACYRGIAVRRAGRKLNGAGTR